MTTKSKPAAKEPREQLVLQLPRSLKRQLAKTAKARKQSMNSVTQDALRGVRSL